MALTDTLDDLINEGRIEPQLAMKVLSNFDRVITEALAEKAKAKLTFKVREMQIEILSISVYDGCTYHCFSRRTGPSTYLPFL
jgi:hypothetical protein